MLMQGKNVLLAILFLVAGLGLIAVAVPEILSGVGDLPQTSLPVPLPSNAIVVGLWVLIEPIPFAVGLVMLIVGVWVLRLSVRTLKIDTSHKAGLVPAQSNRSW